MTAREVLSASAAELYERLLREQSIPFDDPDPRVRPDSDEVEELLARSLATSLDKFGGPRLSAVAPVLALSHALRAAQEELADRHQELERMSGYLLRQQEAFEQARLSQGDDLVRLVTSPDEFMSIARGMASTVREDAVELATHHTTRRGAPVEWIPTAFRPARHRVIVDAAYLDRPGFTEGLAAASAQGVEHRMLPELPTRMQINDWDLALVALTPTGLEGALLVRSRILINTLRTLFELLWQRAAPLGNSSSAGPELAPIQLRVLHLLAEGCRDETIAGKLGVTTRTVRRHVARIQELLEVDSRVAAAVVACRRGLLPVL